MQEFTPEVFEQTRKDIIDNLKNVSEDVKSADSKIATAEKALKDYDLAMCDSKIESLDVLAFVEIQVFDIDVDNSLFGEISKVVEDSVSQEINEMMEASTSVDFKRQITPSRLIKSSELEKSKIFSEDIMGELSDDAYITIQCIQMYNDICQDAVSISERTRKKQLENQQLLYLINSSMMSNPGKTENHLQDSVAYTVALVSSVKDGSRPSLTAYKEKLSDSLNKGINALISSKDIKSSVKVFDSTNLSIQQCKDYLDTSDNPSAKNTKLTLEAVQAICKDKAKDIEQLYQLDKEGLG